MSETLDAKQSGGIDLRKDGWGLALFSAGAFFSVLLALAVGSDEPLDQLTGTGVLARFWASTVGLLPGLLFSLGVAGLGAREFLAGGLKDFRRHARGLGLTALGLSVLLGAFSDTAGGYLGRYSTGTISDSVHLVVGAIVGLVTFLLPIWVFWLKPVILEGAPAPVAEAESPPEPAIDLGVTPAEAAALIPQDLPSWRARARKFGSAEAPPPPSPYPEDVRRRGEIPQGARLLHPPHVETPLAPQVPDQPSLPAVHAVAAGADLALAADGRATEPVIEMLGPVDSRRREEALDELRLALEELTLEDPVEAEALVEAEVPVESASEEAAEIEETVVPPRPSWEQTDLFEAEEEEPVDAYGTPVSVVEAARTETEEREVMLQPVASPRGGRKKAASAPAAGIERAKLLAEIGCHLVERGRVAVSMLQKQYGMDFDEATRTLDELQSLGLIGPYLGGQRRDILLTREEWLEKVSSL